MKKIVNQFHTSLVMEYIPAPITAHSTRCAGTQASLRLLRNMKGLGPAALQSIQLETVLRIECMDDAGRQKLMHSLPSF